MPETPNQKRLPRAREEAAFVESCFLDRKAGSVNFVDCPAIESIEKELPHSTIVHFSCHAMSAEDPSLSGVILVNGNLTVSKISQMNLRGGALAYLSACNTAYSQPDTDLQDESLVLTSAFQVAGFSHVVGTLWTAEDSIATLVAKSFYEELKTDTANSANALHEAVRKQRKEHGKEPWLWAQFICVGA
jgi:CHAT domain-containing protein